MEEVWNHPLKGGCWVPHFSKWLNDWEVGTMEWFLWRLQWRRVYRDKDDKVLWTESKDETFFVKTLYKALESRRQDVFPTSVIWNSWVLLRVGFFVWKAT